jgi:hypothetical protein
MAGRQIGNQTRAFVNPVIIDLNRIAFGENLPEATGSDVGEMTRDDDLHFRALPRGAREPEVRADAFCALRHATESPMTIRLVGGWRCRIKAPAIVATTHNKLMLPIIEVHGDFGRSRMAKGIGQSLSGNAKDLVYYVVLQGIASSFAFYREIEGGNVAQISSHTLNQGFQLSIGEVFGSKPGNSIPPFENDLVGSGQRLFEGSFRFVAGGYFLCRNVKA